nr:hypothetical protein [Mycoplasmopsis bovis]
MNKNVKDKNTSIQIDKMIYIFMLKVNRYKANLDQMLQFTL